MEWLGQYGIIFTVIQAAAALVLLGVLYLIIRCLNKWVLTDG